VLILIMPSGCSLPKAVKIQLEPLLDKVRSSGAAGGDDDDDDGGKVFIDSADSVCDVQSNTDRTGLLLR